MPERDRGDVVQGVSDDMNEAKRDANARANRLEEGRVSMQASGHRAPALVSQNLERREPSLPLVRNRVGVVAGVALPMKEFGACEQSRVERVAIATAIDEVGDVCLMGDHDLGVCVEHGPDQAVAASGIACEEAEPLDAVEVRRVAALRRTSVNLVFEADAGVVERGSDAVQAAIHLGACGQPVVSMARPPSLQSPKPFGRLEPSGVRRFTTGASV